MRKSRLTTQDMSKCAFGTVIMIICSWICIPAPVPFTLQSFGAILVCLTLGRKGAFFSIITYFLLGAVGLPVFSGFKSGIPAFLGPTGGYLWGIISLPFIIGKLSTHKKTSRSLIEAVTGMLLLYILGTIWYNFIYTDGVAGIISALSVCVFPFVVPDAIKCVLAVMLAKKLVKSKILR